MQPKYEINISLQGNQIASFTAQGANALDALENYLDGEGNNGIMAKPWTTVRARNVKTGTVYAFDVALG